MSVETPRLLSCVLQVGIATLLEQRVPAQPEVRMSLPPEVHAQGRPRRPMVAILHDDVRIVRLPESDGGQ